ncbi:MAG: P-loop NTPase fold protein [Planctomycetota bacterium]|jgi:hypothetical protein
MHNTAEVQLTADGMPIFAFEIVDEAAKSASWVLLDEGKTNLRTALVTGGHGAGKTTQMKQMDHHLRQAGSNVSWFNGWRHKEDSDPFASLLFSLWDEVDFRGNPMVDDANSVDRIISAAMRRKGFPSATGVRTRDNMAGGERALLIAADLIGQLKIGSTPLSELAHASQVLSQAAGLSDDKHKQQKLAERARSYGFHRRFREQMEIIVKHLRERQKDPHLPAILMVDDLDRCPPKLGLALLETLTRFFTVPGLVVVIALDEAVARRWVESSYEGNVDGRSYIDKVFDRRVLGVEERARTIWAQILGVEWRMAEWEGLQGKAHPEMADRAVISATRLLRIHGGSDIRKIRRALNEVRTLILENDEFTSTVTLMPDIVRLGVLCGYLIRDRWPRIVDRLSDLRLLEARIEIIREMMKIAPSWADEGDDEALAWLREFLELKDEGEKEIGYILDVKHFLPTDVLENVGANLVLIGMGLR